MKIGIGVTTYNRPECLAKWKEQIAKHTFMDNVLIYVAEDTDQDRQGVAKRKNECLRALKDCDYVFLFDDDCYPVKDGWMEFIIRGANGLHVNFLDGRHHNPIKSLGRIEVFNDCGGVFMYMTKELVEEVGAFDETFEIWGFEHCDWSRRYAGDREFYMVKGTSDYLYAEDYSNPNHKSSITNEEKQKYFNLNFPKFKQPTMGKYIPL